MMTIESLRGKYLLMWNYETQNASRSFGYPKYLIEDDGKLSYIDPDVFPDQGAIQIQYAGNTTVDDILDDYGDIFGVQINAYQNNYNENSPNRYVGKINLDYNQEGVGEIVVRSLSDLGFRQVINIHIPIEEIRETRIFRTTQQHYTRHILLKCGDYYYGPFERNRTDNDREYTIEALAENKYFIGEFSKEKIDEYIAEVGDNNESLVATFVSDFCNDLNNADRKIDFAPDSAIVETLNTIVTYNSGKLNNLNRDQIHSIREMVIGAFETKQIANLTAYRKDKILQMLDSVSEIETVLADIVRQVLSNPSAKNELADYIIENKLDELNGLPAVENWINDQIGDSYRNNPVLLEQIALLEAKNDELVKAAENLQTQLDEAGEIKCAVDYAQLPEKLRNEIEDLKLEIEDFKLKRKDAQDDYNNWIKYKDDVKKELGDLVRDYTNQAKTLARTADSYLLKEVIDIINDTESDKSYVINTYANSNILSYESGEQLLDAFYDFISLKANRKISKDEAANLLVCIANGFITTFAGLPGTGKTSICTIIANALGIAGGDCNRFVQVAVERGWTSNKDYIGYYNPLAKQYEKSNEEMFNAIRQIDYEKKNNQFDAPYLVLLDEANLSPIEHYWSCFNRICDLDAEDRTISLGGDYSWEMSKNLRFLATINFDHTTEELSPRFLDRSWIIMLKPTPIDFQYDDATVQNADSVVSMSDLYRFFTPEKGDVVTDSIRGKWLKIQQAFTSNKLAISPRNVKMVRDYCLVAHKYMKDLTPLDYAVAQKILPVINGCGKQYDDLMSALEREFEGSMPLSYDLVKKMRATASNNFGNYQFF